MAEFAAGNNSAVEKMVVAIPDLSNGFEAKKLPVLVAFNFEYIPGLEVAPELKGLFTQNGEQATLQQNAPPAAIVVSANLEFQVFNAGSRKGWGLRAMQQIEQPNLALFEYAGVLKLTDDVEGDIEEDDYIFAFEWNGRHFLLDANAKGNLARFCNHSCQPNCFTRLAQFGTDGMPHLLVCTKRPIQKGEELTLDYGEQWWRVKSTLNCVCGAEMCKYNGQEGEDVRLDVDEGGGNGMEEDGDVRAMPPPFHSMAKKCAWPSNEAGGGLAMKAAAKKMPQGIGGEDFRHGRRQMGTAKKSAGDQPIRMHLAKRMAMKSIPPRLVPYTFRRDEHFGEDEEEEEDGENDDSLEN